MVRPAYRRLLSVGVVLGILAGSAPPVAADGPSITFDQSSSAYSASPDVKPETDQTDWAVGFSLIPLAPYIYWKSISHGSATITTPQASCTVVFDVEASVREGGSTSPSHRTSTPRECSWSIRVPQDDELCPLGTSKKVTISAVATASGTFSLTGSGATSAVNSAGVVTIFGQPLPWKAEILSGAATIVGKESTEANLKLGADASYEQDAGVGVKAGAKGKELNVEANQSKKASADGSVEWTYTKTITIKDARAHPFAVALARTATRTVPCGKSVEFKGSIQGSIGASASDTNDSSSWLKATGTTTASITNVEITQVDEARVGGPILASLAARAGRPSGAIVGPPAMLVIDTSHMSPVVAGVPSSVKLERPLARVVNIRSSGTVRLTSSDPTILAVGKKTADPDNPATFDFELVPKRAGAVTLTATNGIDTVTATGRVGAYGSAPTTVQIAAFPARLTLVGGTRAQLMVTRNLFRTVHRTATRIRIAQEGGPVLADVTLPAGELAHAYTIRVNGSGKRTIRITNRDTGQFVRVPVTVLRENQVKLQADPAHVIGLPFGPLVLPLTLDYELGRDMTWTARSSNPAVVAVTASGRVPAGQRALVLTLTPASVGSATITVTTNRGMTKTLAITVEP